MSFVLWQREQDISLGGARVVLRADEVPLFAEALQVCEQTAQLRAEEEQRIAVASERARAEAFISGRDEGWQTARDELAAAVHAVVEASARERAGLREEVAALALQVVRKLMGEFADDERLAALALTAARDMLPAPAMTLTVHPDRADGVRQRLEAAPGSDADRVAPRIEVRADPACDPQACTIETEYGSVDAALDAQLQRLAAAWGLRQSAVAE